MKFLIVIFTKNIDKSEIFKNVFNIYATSFEISVESSCDINLEKYKDHQLVLLDSDYNDASIVYDYKKNSKQLDGIIVFSDDEEKVKAFECKKIISPKKLKLIPILNVLNDFFSSFFPDILTQKLSDEFLPVKISKLLNLTTIQFDIFLKLSDSKFVKCINQGDSLFQESLLKYQDKNFIYLYLKTTDYYASFDLIFENLITSYDENSTISKESYYANSQNVIFELMGEVGISENVIQVSAEIIQDICKEYQKSEFSQLFEKFKYSKDRYIFDHSTMTSMFAISLCGRFEWKNEEIYKKLTMAALYHDFGFHNPKLAIIEQDKDEIDKLTKSFRREVLDHPEVMATKLSHLKGVPSEVIYIIQRHHEIHEDCGYKKMVSRAYLSVLECIFITAHEFTNQIYKIAFRPDKMHLAITRTLLILNSGNFKQVRAPFLEMVKKNYIEGK